MYRDAQRLAGRRRAEVLNAGGIPTPEIGKWYTMQMIRVRKRLAEK
jgi:hypothetical protein